MRKAFCVLVLVLAGCAPMTRMWDAATSPPKAPHPAPTPLEEIGDGLYHLVLNPLDIGAWLQVAGAVGVIGAAGFGARHVHRKRTARKAARAAAAAAK